MWRRCVSMALPGTPGQRISDLCNGNYITQRELAEKIGVSAFQLSWIVSGETRTVRVIFSWAWHRNLRYQRTTYWACPP